MHLSKTRLSTSLSTSALVIAVLVATAGCIVTVSFDPRGTDTSLSGSWLVDGQVPTASSCAAVGLGQIQLVFFSEGKAYRYADFTFPCSQQSFDTRPTNVLKAGRYTLQWFGLTTAGGVVAMSSMQTIDATFGDHVVVPTVDFITSSPRGTDVSLDGGWQVNGVAANPTNCAAAGIDTVQLVFFDSKDTPYIWDDFRFPCGQGSFDTRPDGILRHERYSTQWFAYNSADQEVGRSATEVLDVSMSTLTHATLRMINFVVPSTLVVNLQWQIPGTTQGQCVDAGVSKLTYTLTGPTTRTDFSQLQGACTNAITWADIPNGTYSLFIDAESSGGSRKWMQTCPNLVVNGGTDSYTCVGAL